MKGVNETSNVLFLRMCCLMLGYSFEPRPNSRALGKEGSFTTIVFINKRILALRKPV